MLGAALPVIGAAVLTVGAAVGADGATVPIAGAEVCTATGGALDGAPEFEDDAVEGAGVEEEMLWCWRYQSRNGLTRSVPSPVTGSQPGPQLVNERTYDCKEAKQMYTCSG